MSAARTACAVSSACCHNPAGLGSILEGWRAATRAELAAWIELARTRIAPHFDITPEILTHTLALDLTTARAAASNPSTTGWLIARSTS